MSWIVAGLTVGSAIYKGFSAMGNKADVDAAEAAAGDIQQEGLDLVESQYTTGMEELSQGTRTGALNIQTGGNQAISQSNLVTSGTIQDKIQTQMAGLIGGHKTTAQKIQDTKERGIMSAEEAYQSTLTGLESQPTTFLEGMFG